MNKIFIARDGEPNGKNDRELNMFDEQPEVFLRVKFGQQYAVWDSKGKAAIARNAFDFITNGTCQEFSLSRPDDWRPVKDEKPEEHKKVLWQLHSGQRMFGGLFGDEVWSDVGFINFKIGQFVAWREITPYEG